jgi:hypothetical protein
MVESHAPTAAEINARNQEMFDRAADLLGPENFREIFGAAAYEEVNLVDPHFLSESGTDRPTQYSNKRNGGRRSACGRNSYIEPSGGCSCGRQ